MINTPKQSCNFGIYKVNTKDSVVIHFEESDGLQKREFHMGVMNTNLYFRCNFQNMLWKIFCQKLWSHQNEYYQYNPVNTYPNHPVNNLQRKI